MKKTALFLGAAALLTVAFAVQAQVPGVNSTLNSVFTLAYDNSTMKPTYSSWNSYNPAATGATDICTITGSATKNIRVRRVFFNGIATTAATDPVAIIKRSTASSGGTATFAVTSVPYDSSNAAVTATVTYYTANPTVGTIVGVVADPMFSFGNLTTGGAQALPSQMIFGALGQPIVLRGVAQSLSVNLNNLIYPGLVASCGFEWTEE